MMHVLLVTPDMAENSVGRTYCLHLICEELGWTNETWSLHGRDDLWAPLLGTPFAQTCHVPGGSREQGLADLSRRAAQADLVVAVKPRPDSLGIAWDASGGVGVPLLLDIDDPDIAVQQAYGTPVRRLAKRLLRRRVIADATRMETLIGQVSAITVSNPVLQERHGGSVVTHVRQLPPLNQACGQAGGTRIVFVGSIQPNKGLPVLRRAVDRLAGEGFRLTITAPPPRDARAHEDWIGLTTLEEGTRLAASADVVVIPSLDATWSRGQLPVKLVDALLAGTPTIVTDVQPLPWAIGAHGMVTDPGDLTGLVRALRVLGNPAVRSAYGAGLRAGALERFSLERNAAAFASEAEKARTPSPDLT